MQAPEFSVIIVNYNGGDYICAAVRSLAAQTFRNFEVIVLDNASTDGSADKIDFTGVPSAQLVRNADNLGFAAANNLGAHMATGRWLALLNPDAEAAPDWLEKIAAASRRHPDCRVFASAQYDMAHPDHIDGAGDAYLIFGLPWRGGFGHPASHMPAEGECFSPCGAAAIYDRTLFLEHGGFDERFFCYCEDVDLGFRMQLADERCIFLPDAIVHHMGSAITGKHSKFSAYHGTRNRIWTYAKNMPLLLLLLTLPVHIVLSIYLIFRNAFIGCFSATLRGTWDGLRKAMSIRRGTDWKTDPRKVPVWALSRTMAWNPHLLNSRAAHVRPVTGSKHVPSSNPNAEKEPPAQQTRVGKEA
ncbi:glycosyltransferase family 2 protein [Hyphomonas sp.]|nr:glycosyltransferase family 2 protein [Hyphomonas sp.]MAB09572.1 glycosyl transferase family 2 [Hyphomonas sp.]MAU67545.1 glycosyl transferase family 2 [Hyphomonas sp.]MBM56730.1 glycosyl transferase family 2 [Hyphomonas sp.]